MPNICAREYTFNSWTQTSDSPFSVTGHPLASTNVLDAWLCPSPEPEDNWSRTNQSLS
jgi:hypothetical protein